MFAKKESTLLTKMLAMNLFFAMLFFSTDAFSQRRGGGGGGRGGQVQIPGPGQGHHHQQKLKFVASGLYIQTAGRMGRGGYQRPGMNNIIKVKKEIAKQNGRGVLQGLQLTDVVVILDKIGHRANAALLINGQFANVSTKVKALDYYGKTKLKFSLFAGNRFQQNIIGQDINTIQVQINGRTVVKKIKVLAKVPHRSHRRGGRRGGAGTPF